jgi:NADH-quinone oxidoreductase subunit G
MKRVVKDRNIIRWETTLQRCIHCTRLRRFGEEITGFQELGTMGRGENMNIEALR